MYNSLFTLPHPTPALASFSFQTSTIQSTFPHHLGQAHCPFHSGLNYSVTPHHSLADTSTSFLTPLNGKITPWYLALNHSQSSHSLSKSIIQVIHSITTSLHTFLIPQHTLLPHLFSALPIALLHHSFPRLVSIQPTAKHSQTRLIHFLPLQHSVTAL